MEHRVFDNADDFNAYIEERREIRTVDDVPQRIREQIVKEALEKKLRELREENNRFHTDNSILRLKVQRFEEMLGFSPGTSTVQQISEMRQYASVVAEIRATLAPDSDARKVLTDYHTALNRLAESLGVKEFASINVHLEEGHQKVAEMRGPTDKELLERGQRFVPGGSRKVREFAGSGSTSPDGKPTDEELLEMGRQFIPERGR